MMIEVLADIVQRFLLSVCVGWFGSVIPVLMSGMVRNLSWGARLLLQDWIVHGSFAVLLLLWIAMMLALLQRVWRKPGGSKVTFGHQDQRLAAPRPFPIKPRSMITPIATTSMPLKLDTPPNEADAQQ